MAENTTPDHDDANPDPVTAGNDTAPAPPPAAPVKAPKPAARASAKKAPKERFEEYTVPRASDGAEVRVRRNVDTGATEIVDG